MTVLPFPTEEHKEEALDSKKNLDFKARIAAERKVEAEELVKQQEKEAILRGEKSKKVEKPKKVKKARKPRAKKVKVVKELTPPPVKTKKITLPVYHHQVEVNEFNKFKVDYIRKQIHFCKDPKRKMIYENALKKYKLE